MVDEFEATVLDQHHECPAGRGARCSWWVERMAHSTSAIHARVRSGGLLLRTWFLVPVADHRITGFVEEARTVSDLFE